KRTDKVVHGLQVARVEIAGPFLAPGTDMKSQGTFPNWRMLGAIVDGKEGRVFFKLTGPDAGVQAVATGFDALLASLAPRCGRAPRGANPGGKTPGSSRKPRVRRGQEWCERVRGDTLAALSRPPRASRAREPDPRRRRRRRFPHEAPAHERHPR